MRRSPAFVSLRFRRYHLRAGMWPTLAVLALLPLLVGLGLWQLERAATKQQLQSEFDRRQGDAPVYIGGRLQTPEELRFNRVRTRGRYEPRYQILLDNRVHRGQAGYHVLTPLHIEGSETRVLVNRGWVALGSDRARLPRIETPEGVVEVTGVAAAPQAPGISLGAAKPPGSGWQVVWQYLDFGEYRQSVSFPVQPAVVLLDPDSSAGGFIRQWQRLDSGIATHQGYAFQWFALAVALAAIYILVNTRKNDDAATNPDNE